MDPQPITERHAALRRLAETNPTYHTCSKFVIEFARDVADRVHRGELDEVVVPLELRDYIRNIRGPGWQAPLHNIGMRTFKQAITSLRSKDECAPTSISLSTTRVPTTS